MIHAIDLVLLSLYLVALACALYIIGAHIPYYRERIKSGVVNLFMVAMLFFLVAYVFKMVTVIWIRMAAILQYKDPALEAIQLYAWAIAQLGTTAGLVSLAVLTYTKHFDLFIYLRKIDRKGEK
ncbi:hypothetical protein J31TS4_19040 [Paenibacillus sp. J31TS4]|uniref:hypothetical protein n=1 Tax=Paenibacillus sp. J31TS4 TaxID=2807195 RepID=UPI001B1B21D0|nr:hypothetical protein [Paenibacillus sp. J31TS4]GIP38624.1 hypothetical protein J31TS4_19040 [Paenibacillus sp. J31TS4]